MQPQSSKHSRIGLWTVLAVGLAYCAWLGLNWLPLPYSDKELAAFVSRLWDVQTEFAAGHGLTWWTPFYMNGSSYGLNHSQGLYLLPCLLLAKFVSLPAAVKLTSLLAIFAGGWAMYGCARYFIKNEWAAAFAGIVFLLHPEQIIRAAGAEHLGVILFLPFMPLTFWLMAKALDTGAVPQSVLLRARSDRYVVGAQQNGVYPRPLSRWVSWVPVRNRPATLATYHQTSRCCRTADRCACRAIHRSGTT